MKARISVNDIRALHFSTYGANPETVGNPREIIRDLEQWANGLEFGQTGLEYLNRGKSYCLAMRASSRYGTVLCLWHALPTVDGAVLYADESTRVGRVSVSKNPVGKGKIPGVPAYYWFPSGTAVVCCVRLPERVASRLALSNFFKAFMSSRCTLANRTESIDDDGVHVVCLRSTEDDRRLRAVVDLATATRDDYGDLRAQARKIRAIERKDTIAKPKHELPPLLKQTFGYEEDDLPKATQVHYRFDVPEGISAAFFDEIVEFYEEQGSEDLDIGFHKANEGIQWLSSRRLASTHELEVPESGGVVSDLEQLAKELGARQSQILGGRSTKQ